MEGDLRSAEKKGIIPRAVDALFEGVTNADENMEFTIKVSYVEIYLEKIRDLLDDNRLKVNLTIREDPIKGIYIAGVTEEYVTSPEETLQVMHAGTYVVDKGTFVLCSCAPDSIFVVSAVRCICTCHVWSPMGFCLLDLFGVCYRLSSSRLCCVL